jgi:hypothetical protein
MITSSTTVASTPHQIWWEVRPVLLLDQSDRPAADGSSGIAIEVGSNFFLFFTAFGTADGC